MVNDCCIFIFLVLELFTDQFLVFKEDAVVCEKVNKLAISFLLLTSFSSYSSTVVHDEFMPENNLYIGPNDKSANDQVTEEVFNKIIDNSEKVYTPMIKKMGGVFKVNRNWTDGTVNASAMRKLNVWEVNMYGGLARHALVTPDAFALVLCHEIGHHMGGAPKIAGFFQKWASNEGQSDYYGTAKCFRLIYSQDNNEDIVARMKIPAMVKDECQKAYANNAESALCMRISMAGLSLAELLGELGRSAKVDFTTPDTTQVRKTNDAHPKAQCRLDTYFQGALCDRPMGDKPSDRDATQGYCSTRSGHKVGLRPLCWYFPKE